jgi:hypothetical protein
MKYIKTFRSITEAVSLPIARKATKIFLSSGGKQRYNEIFNGKDRLYYDIEDSLNKIYVYNPLENAVKTALNTSGYEVIDYNKGIASKNDDSKNVFKIQRILNKIGELDLKNKMDADPLRFSSSKKDKMVVISRHGVDIAGQSTGRDWTSCKSVSRDDRGTNSRYVWTEIEKGSLVAYLITPEDLNIEKPIARILIGVYVNQIDPNDFILYPDNSVYGNYRKEDFMNFIKSWCMDLNKKISPKNTGIYKISDKCYVDHVRNIRLNSDVFDDIKSYIEVDINSKNIVIGDSVKNNMMRDIFKKIEEQESILTPKEIFTFLNKVGNDFKPEGYAEFINLNPYDVIEKYMNKYPDFLVNYMTRINYDLITDKNKENKIRDMIKKYLAETEGDGYITSFTSLLNSNSPSIPRDFIRWIL